MQETLVQFLGQEDPLEKGIGYPFQYSWAPLVSAGKESASNAGDGFYPWEDPLEKGTATLSSILALRIPWSMGSQRVGHSDFHFHFTPH